LPVAAVAVLKFLPALITAAVVEQVASGTATTSR
jgi:hypothetical protein